MALSDDPKQGLRQSILRERMALVREDAIFRSETVCANFLKHAEKLWKPEEFAGQVVALYAIHPDNPEGELDPSPVRESPLFRASQFAYPRILSRADGKMEFALAQHATDWIKSPYGFPEPRFEIPSIDPKDIALFIVPGVAFGERGERMGRGAGFYDRYLKRAPGAIRVGVGYDFQILRQAIPENAWDERMDWVMGESISLFPQRT